MSSEIIRGVRTRIAGRSKSASSEGMRNLLRVAVGWVVVWYGVTAAWADDASSADAFETKLDALSEEVDAVFEANETVTSEMIAPQLVALADLAEEYSGTDPEKAATALRRKAVLEAVYLEEYAVAKETLEQLEAHFPETAEGKKGAAMLRKLEIIATLQPGMPFPPFELTDLDGAPLRLEDFKGKIVLIDFWATWCPPCRAELPNVKAAYARFHEAGFEIVGLSLDKSRERLESFLENEEMTWPQHFDGEVWESPIVAKYGVLAIPTTYLLDRDGTIIASGLFGEALGEKLEELLGGTDE